MENASTILSIHIVMGSGIGVKPWSLILANTQISDYKKCHTNSVVVGKDLFELIT
jgi:hypothetical protein